MSDNEYIFDSSEDLNTSDCQHFPGDHEECQYDEHDFLEDIDDLDEIFREMCRYIIDHLDSYDDLDWQHHEPIFEATISEDNDDHSEIGVTLSIMVEGHASADRLTEHITEEIKDYAKKQINKLKVPEVEDPQLAEDQTTITVSEDDLGLEPDDEDQIVEIPHECDGDEGYHSDGAEDGEEEADEDWMWYFTFVLHGANKLAWRTAQHNKAIREASW